MIISPAKDSSGKPIVEIQVHVDDVVEEAVKLLQSARIQMELLTNNVNDHVNISLSDVSASGYYPQGT